MMKTGLSPCFTTRKASFFASFPEIKKAQRNINTYSTHIPFKAERNVMFVKLCAASTVLYSVIMYTIIQAVTAVKTTDSSFVSGILFSSYDLMMRVKSYPPLHKKDSKPHPAVGQWQSDIYCPYTYKYKKPCKHIITPARFNTIILA